MTGREVFSRIARRYDTLNTVLSFGRDGSWRRRAIAHLPEGRVLDLGGGTGAANREFAGREVVALDPNRQMLSLNPELRRVVGIGEQLPFADGSFDGVFSAFVFRNLESVDSTMDEVARILRPGGVAAIVDLARPISPVARVVHRVGTAVTLPLAGLMVGAPGEYWYLHKSLDKLPPPEILYGTVPMRFEELWRMGPLGFVYGAVFRKV